MAITLKANAREHESENSGITTNVFSSTSMVGGYHRMVKMTREQYDQAKNLVFVSLMGVTLRLPLADRGVKYNDNSHAMDVYVDGYHIKENDFVRRRTEHAVKAACKKLGIKYVKPPDDGPIFYEDAYRDVHLRREKLGAPEVQDDTDWKPRNRMVAALVSHPEQIVNFLLYNPDRFREAIKRANNELNIIEEESLHRTVGEKEQTSRLLTSYAIMVADSYKDEDIEATIHQISILPFVPDDTKFSNWERKKLAVALLAEKAEELDQSE